MHNWNDIDHNRQRRAAFLHEAAAERLATGLSPARLRTHRLRPFVLWTGRRMVTVGFSLLALAREWEYRPNTMYNGAKSTMQQP